MTESVPTPRPFADHTKQRSDSLIFTSPNQLKLGVFATNLSGGAAGATFSPKALKTPDFDETRELAIKADKAGIEAFIPITRWKGFGTDSKHWDRTWETLTWAAALAEATDNISVFSTCIPHTIHPVAAAKMGATVDHISKGRWGLNIVAGWMGGEFEMFGNNFADHSGRYRYATEWFDIVKKCWTEDEEFDYKGEFFDLKGVISEPKPVTAPAPPVMNAGQSGEGKTFAVNNADMIFINVDDKGMLAETITELRDEAAAVGKSISIWGIAHITARATAEEAEAVMVEHSETLGADEAARAYANILMGGDATSQKALRENTALEKSLLRTGANMNLIGTPAQIAAKLAEISSKGVDGIALIWNDYNYGLQQFIDEIEPLLIEAGVRVPASNLVKS